MTRSRLVRYWAVLVVLYVALDITDPSIRGVFFFDNGTLLFVESVVQAKSHASTPLATATAPMPLGDIRLDERCAAVKLDSRSRASRPPHLPWKNLKHDDSTSFASSSPDTPPTPPLS